jgi:hypothetical protein
VPTTSYTAVTSAASILGSRTDAAGGAVTDTTAEEARLGNILLSQGYIQPTNAWVVAPQASPNMTVKVGSGTAKADHYAVVGQVAGQGNYIARLDVTSQNVTITAADASQTRTDEVWLVVRDNAYDSSARVLPQIGYRQGDLGGANPGPDATWKAAVLLARVTVPAAATSITAGQISDQRSAASLNSALTTANVLKSLFTTKGDLAVATGASTPARLGVGTDGDRLTADSAQASGLRWSSVGETQVRYLLVDDQANTTSEPIGNGTPNEFTFTVAASARYAVECFIPYGCSAADDLRLEWSAYPSGTTISWASWGVPSSIASQIGSIDTGIVAEGVFLTVAGNDNPGPVDGSCRPTATVLVGGTPGVITMSFRAANSGLVTIRAGAWMKITRLV